jgi:hypothetical protein
MKGNEMPRRGKSAIRKAGGAIVRTARKLTSKLNPRKRSAVNVAEAPEPRATPAPARVTRRPADVPLDLIADSYLPKQTSLKTSFRSDGADREKDQELPLAGFDRWQDEDHFTNKSGDTRIGTHGRSYEPGEQRAASANPRRR